ncbi:MAG: hypothetical protein JF587_25280, partial [Catenulisporales bacterium]|nr:hypothetical protein [Catenulisporales bacterium]
MPDRGDERGRGGGTRTLVTGILAGTEWHPADSPQEATATAREARDLAVRLRPVLSKLAQAPRSGRRRDLDWLPAVEQLAVDAQYFASWWLPRLEGKSAQSWPSWSADGYADWVKRLDAQRVRTLEMVQNSAPAPRGATVTQLRRGKAAPEQEDEGSETAAAAEGAQSAESAGTEPSEAPEGRARHARGKGRERIARIMPIRGSGAPVVAAAGAGAAITEEVEREGTHTELPSAESGPAEDDQPAGSAPSPHFDDEPDRPDDVTGEPAYISQKPAIKDLSAFDETTEMPRSA